MYWVEKIICRIADYLYSKYPRPFPDKVRLTDCRIISHRGEHDNKNTIENTLKAFDIALENKIFGIEFDLRWTKDLKPVVFHDRNTKRLFKKNLNINETTFSDLKSSIPQIPSLADTISRYGKKLHLMVEMKEEFYPEPVYQAGVLKDLFSALEPVKDYHLISLSPRIFDIIGFVPETAFIPVARFNTERISEIALKKNYGGIAGHYLLIPDSMFKKHTDNNQKIGTGFIGSQNSLFRELNRGAEWIFSNDAAKLQAILSHILKNQI
ncbi:MAG: glycerophosphodiester phosphodiesterase [Desulfobacteraceae bacterium]|nr:MAG: glycerophosphodiester phosphodiesterase [Desulfobacteraceae bacterium]